MHGLSGRHLSGQCGRDGMRGMSSRNGPTVYGPGSVLSGCGRPHDFGMDACYYDRPVYRRRNDHVLPPPNGEGITVEGQDSG